MSRADFPKPKFVVSLPQDQPETPIRGGKQEYWEIADTLRSRPGQWARVAIESTYENVIGSAIRNGGALAFKPAGSFEAKRFVRVTTEAERQDYLKRGLHIDRIAEVYARFVGEVEA